MEVVVHKSVANEMRKEGARPQCAGGRAQGLAAVGSVTLFSSIAAVIGTAGSSCYAAANACLDGLSECAAKQGTPALLDLLHAREVHDGLHVMWARR